jgi:hypothetical protein
VAWSERVITHDLKERRVVLEERIVVGKLHLVEVDRVLPRQNAIAAA